MISSDVNAPPLVSLRDSWELRNAAAATLVNSEQHLRRMLQAADAAQVVALLETFSPARSPGPEWTRSFDPLVERLWMWCDDAVLATTQAEFQARGAAWLPVANALTPERGAEIRGQLRRTEGAARLPRFTLA